MFKLGLIKATRWATFRHGSRLLVLAMLVATLMTSALAAVAAVDAVPAAASGSIRVTIKGLNHAPIVNKKWTYTVTVTSSSGQRLRGTETTHYLYNGSVVGTEKPQNVPFKNGVYHDTLEFPASAVGYSLVVQASVSTRDGVGKAGWSIKVKS